MITETRTEIKMSSKEAYVLLGPPGSGKSSITNDLVLLTGAKRIRGKDLIPESTAIYGPNRKLIPDEEFVPAMRSVLNNQSLNEIKSIVFDNIPRTANQAREIVKWAQNENRVLNVISLLLSVEEVLDRVLNRFVCPVCQDSYHPTAKPSLEVGICDKDKSVLVKRSGDKPELVPEAYRTYLNTVNSVIPILGNYGNILEVSASKTVLDSLSLIRSNLLPALV